MRDHRAWLNLEDLGGACYICNASGDELFETETEHGSRVVCLDCRVDWPKEDSSSYEEIGVPVGGVAYGGPSFNKPKPY